jgi:hypothetical protein
MTIFEFLSPVDFWQSLRKTVINVKNWNFYVKCMRRLKEDGSLAQMGMRLDMRSRAYYILNLEPETLMMGSEVLELEKSRVLESIAIKKGIFEKAGLFELIEVKTERIKNENHYGYLIQVKYLPSANASDWFHVVSWVSLFAICSNYLISNWRELLETVKTMVE